MAVSVPNKEEDNKSSETVLSGRHIQENFNLRPRGIEMFVSEAQDFQNNFEIIKRVDGPPGTSLPGMRHGKKNTHKEFIYSERYNERDNME